MVIKTTKPALRTIDVFYTKEISAHYMNDGNRFGYFLFYLHFDKLEFVGLEHLHNFTEFFDGAALVYIIFHHLREFLFIITCDAVR